MTESSGGKGGGPDAHASGPERAPLVWRLALRTLPREFRRRNDADLEAAARVLLEGRGPLGRMAGWLRSAIDLVVTGARLRRSHRYRSRASLVDRLVQDLRFALRALRRRPGFTLIAVLTLALGIGANTAVFSAVHGVLLRPLPYADSEELGILWHRFGDGAQDLPAVHPLDVRDYEAWSETLDAWTMATGRDRILGGADDPEVVHVGSVRANFFDFLGTGAVLGRTFAQGEDDLGGPRLAVLSHRVWAERYGSDPEVIGRAIPLDGGRVEVIGVLPRDFRLLLPGEAFRLRDADVWVPVQIDPARLPPRNYTGFTAFARLAPGATFEAAQAEVRTMARTLRETHGEHASSNLEARIEPLRTDVVKSADTTLLILFGAVGVVLLIACANVANLMLVRGHGRRGELAVRKAIGADRAGLVRLTLVESAVLGVGGVALGLVLAFPMVEVLSSLAGAGIPRLETITLDGTVLAFASVAGLAAVLLVGLVPGLVTTRRDAAVELHAEGRTGTGPGANRLKNALIVGQVAGSMVLVVATALMVRSFAALSDVDPGYDAADVLTFRTVIPRGSFDGPEGLRALRMDLLDRIEAHRGVVSAAITSQLPLTGSGTLRPYAWNEETAAAWESVTADQRGVSPAFFEVMDARFVEGRTFLGDPALDQGTIVIDERLAARAFPDRSAVGQRLQVEPNGTPEEDRYARVVGVVEHLRLHDLSAPYLTQIWQPMFGSTDLSVAVESEDDLAVLAGDMRRIVAEVLPGAPVQDVRPMSDLTAAARAPVRLALGLMAGFGVVALGLAAVGIYGVLSYVVGQRTREIGIRMTLGLDPAAARREVLWQGGRLVAVAVVLGLVLSAGLTRAVSGLLYGVSALDPVAYLLSPLILVAMALIACWIPARRATRVDPVEALRD